MRSIILYVWLTAVRDRLFAGLIVLMLALYGVAVFFAGTASIEQQSFLLVLLAGGVRLLLAVGLVTFVAFHVRRSFDQKEVDVALSRPITRTRFVLGYAIGLAGVATALVLLATGVTALGGILHLQAFALWAFTLWCEALLIVVLGLAVALILRSAVLIVLGCLSLYLMGRMAILFINTAESAFSRTHTLFDTVGPSVLQAISMVTPRLDLLAQTRWLVYGLEGQPVGWVLLQPLLYIPLLLTIAIIDFRRKQF